MCDIGTQDPEFPAVTGDSTSWCDGGIVTGAKFNDE